MTQSDEDFVDDLDDLDDDNLDELNPTSARSTSDKGLTKDEKQLLLKCVDKKGGIAKCSRESGIVEAICNWKPAVFGLANSPKRRATQNVITKWKQHARNKTFLQDPRRLGSAPTEKRLRRRNLDKVSTQHTKCKSSNKKSSNNKSSNNDNDSPCKVNFA